MPPSAGGGEPPPYSRRTQALLWLALALLWFAPLNSPHLFDPDEGRYAEIPREMVVSGNWITPRLDGLQYFEKPPLQYWATAVAFELAGQHAWTVRLWPAVCGYLSLVLSFLLGRRLYGQRTALFTVIIQASSLLYVGLARVATLDMGLCFTLQLAMSALALLAQRTRPDEAARSTWAEWGADERWLPLLLGAGVALAVLSKGLVGLLIPAAVAMLYMLVYRDWRLPLAARPWWTLVALLVIAAPWFVLVWQRNPAFARFFFLYEHFQRYLNSAGFDRYQPGWFFVPVLAAGLLPWSTLLPRALIDSARAARTEPACGLLLIWAAFVFAFFSLSQSKLVPYILPMVPALSLLLGRKVAQLPPRRLAAHLFAVGVGAALIAAAVLLLWQLPQGAKLVAAAGSGASIIALAVAFGVLALGAFIGAAWCRRGRALAGAAAIAVGALLLTQAALVGAERLPRMQADAELARQLRPWIGNYRHFYCVGDYIQTVPFYLGRICTLVGYRGELDFGLDQEPWRGIADLAQFKQLWSQENSALALLRPALYQQLQASGVPMHVIYSAPSFIVVVRQ